MGDWGDGIGGGAHGNDEIGKPDGAMKNRLEDEANKKRQAEVMAAKEKSESGEIDKESGYGLFALAREYDNKLYKYIDDSLAKRSPSLKKKKDNWGPAASFAFGKVSKLGVGGILLCIIGAPLLIPFLLVALPGYIKEFKDKMGEKDKGMLREPIILRHPMQRMPERFREPIIFHPPLQQVPRMNVGYTPQQPYNNWDRSNNFYPRTAFNPKTSYNPYILSTHEPRKNQVYRNNSYERKFENFKQFGESLGVNLKKSRSHMQI